MMNSITFPSWLSAGTLELSLQIMVSLKIVPAKTYPVWRSPKRLTETKKIGNLILRSFLSVACLTFTVMWVSFSVLRNVSTARPAKKRWGSASGLTFERIIGFLMVFVNWLEQI